MQRTVLALIIFLVIAVVASAQDDVPTPYEIALERIEEARINESTKLSLARLSLETLPSEIGNLTNLRILWLEQNNLTGLPPEIGNLNNLEILWLDNNPLIGLPTEIGNLTNLKALWLQETDLQELPTEIGNLTNLQELYLGSTAVSTLPPEIGNLTNLEWLYVSSPKLSELPPEIGNLTNLRVLSIGVGMTHNIYYSGLPRSSPLNELPAEIYNLTNLTRLTVAGTEISSLSSEIGNLEQLCFLDIRSNQLRYLPSEIGYLPYLDNGRIAEIFEEDNCSHRAGTSISYQSDAYEIFRHMREDWIHLEELAVYGNPLEMYPDRLVSDTLYSYNKNMPDTEDLQRFIRNPLLWYLKLYAPWIVGGLTAIRVFIFVLRWIIKRFNVWRGMMRKPKEKAKRG